MNGPTAGDRTPRRPGAPNPSAALLPLLGLWITLGATLFHGAVAAVITGGGTLAGSVVLHRTVRRADERLRRTVRRAALRALAAAAAVFAVSAAVYGVGAATGGGDASATASGVFGGLGAVVFVIAATLVAATRAAGPSGDGRAGGR